METKESEPNQANSGEAYAHGYDSALTLKMHASRTADNQAGCDENALEQGHAGNEPRSMAQAIFN